MTANSRITYKKCSHQDAELLVAIRIAAMKESLEKIGRFDPQRARERFLSGFDPNCTEFILEDDQIIGFIAVKSTDTNLSLDHLYINPEHQGKGIGAMILKRVFSEADNSNRSVTVGALRESNSNRFYQRHGFCKSAESEWDIYYIRHANTEPA
jgi:ribosomal protein S18 acetylase RimI-like enzyme